MARRKEKIKIIHEPSISEIFYCLSEMPSYSKILLGESTDKSYADFLGWLIMKNFYREKDEKITIKKIATDFKADSSKVTKWLKEIYEQIFELNFDKPKLFLNNGIKVCLVMKYFDSSCSIYTSLPSLPREFERVSFPFIKGKVGTDHFWVRKIEHEIVEDSAIVTLWLEGGILNRYREFALDKALFQGWIHFMDVYQKEPFELDNEIKKVYRT